MSAAHAIAVSLHTASWVMPRRLGLAGQCFQPGTNGARGVDSLHLSVPPILHARALQIDHLGPFVKGSNAE